MSASRQYLIFLVLFAFMAPFFAFTVTTSHSEDVAASAIEKAEGVMVLAYQGVLEAERAGADVSRLLTRLNVASEYLARAHILYRVGDLDDATRFADLCFETAEKVKPEADRLRNTTLVESDMRLRFTMTESVVSVCLISVAGFLSWRVFKRRYHQRVLGMKPELVSDES